MADLLRFPSLPSPVQASAFAPPGTARRRAAAATEAAPSLDPKLTGDLLLIKTVLDGKDFQTARHEVVRQQAEPSAAAPEPAPEARPAGPAATSSVTVEMLAFSATSLHIEVQRGDQRIEMDYARLSLQRHRETSAPAKAQDPLLLDLDGSGPRTTGPTGAASFDLAGDGRSAPTSFVTGGSAFLALDRNGNGRIDDGGELFGDQHGAADGYEELRRFDGNGDGAIDGQDPVFARLQLLRGDGSLQAVQAAGLRTISLDAQRVQGYSSGGDAILRSAVAQREDGVTIGTYAMALNTFDQRV